MLDSRYQKQNGHIRKDGNDSCSHWRLYCWFRVPMSMFAHSASPQDVSCNVPESLHVELHWPLWSHESRLSITHKDIGKGILSLSDHHVGRDHKGGKLTDGDRQSVQQSVWVGPVYHLYNVERNRSAREDLVLFLKCSGNQFYLRKSWHFHRRERNRKVKNMFSRREVN